MSETLSERHARHAEYCRDRLAQEAALERAFDMNPGDARDWAPVDNSVWCSGFVDARLSGPLQPAITDTTEGRLDHATGVLTPWPVGQFPKPSFEEMPSHRHETVDEAELRRAHAQAWRL